MNNFLCASDDAISHGGRSRFTLDEPRCPEPYVHGFVLARFVGSGRLARLWLTAASIRRAPADDELLRIYIDDAPDPGIALPLSRALDGSGGETFARPFGTGTEDYFNDAFFFEGGATATAFAQAWSIGISGSGPSAHGHASACRWHVLGDAIDFRRSLELTIEMGPDLPGTVERYRSIAFLYR